MAVSSVLSSPRALALCAGLWLVPLARAEAPPAVPAASSELAPPLDAPPAPAPAPASLGAPAPAAHEPRPEADLTTANLEEGAAPGSESLTWMLLRTLFVFGGVMALIYLTLNVGLRKLMGLQGVAVGRQALVSVVERVPLDQRRSLFVVKAAGEYLLVGGGENGLQLVHKLDTDAVERMRGEPPPVSHVMPLSPFLKKLIARRDVSSPGSPPPGVPRPPDAA